MVNKDYHKQVTTIYASVVISLSLSLHAKSQSLKAEIEGVIERGVHPPTATTQLFPFPSTAPLAVSRAEPQQKSNLVHFSFKI